MSLSRGGALALASGIALLGTLLCAIAGATGFEAETAGAGATPPGPRPRWTTLADGPRSDGNARPSCDSQRLGRSLAVDADGASYVSGLAGESNRFFLLKYGAGGDLIWQREFHSSSRHPVVPLFLHRDADGPRVGVVVPEHLGYSVHMFSAEGLATWSSTLVPVAPETREFDARSAALSPDGHVYVVGYRDYGSGFVARHSAGGAADWVIVEPGIDLRGVEVAGTSGVVTWGSGVDEPSILRFDAQGNRLWARTLANEQGWTLDARDLEIEPTGETYFAGSACLHGDCRPAMGALGADGTWRWSRILESGSGLEPSFRALSVGSGRVYGLLERGAVAERFIDIFGFDTDGESTGVHSVGPFSAAYAAESFVDRRGWLWFSGSVEIEDAGQLLLGSLSPAGVLHLDTSTEDGLTNLDPCDLVEGQKGVSMFVGGRSVSPPPSTDMVIGAFSKAGSVAWTRREPEMSSPDDVPGSRMGPDRKGPAVHRSADGTFWVVGGASPPNSTQRERPAGWHFAADGALLGTVAPFGPAGFRQWAESAVPAVGNGLAMVGTTSVGTWFPFVAAFSSALAETMRYVDDAAGAGWANAGFRAGNGDFLVAQRTFELLRVGPAGELLNRVNADSVAYLLNDSVLGWNDTVWMVGSAQAADLEVDCVIAGLSGEDGLAWSRTFGIAGISDTCSAVDARAGRVVAAGRHQPGPFLVSFGENGEFEWSLEGATGFGAPWSSIGQVLLDAAGNAWVAGRVQGSRTPSLAKLSPSGLLLWATPLEDEASGAPNFDLDEEGRAFVLVDPGTTWPVLFGLDSNGEVLWRSALGNAFRSLRVVSGGQLVLTGSRTNVHSNDLLVAVFDVADFLFGDGFESGDVTGWSSGESSND